MTLKNNIEAIIIKWAYQIDEVLSRDSDEELNIPGTYLFHTVKENEYQPIGPF